MTFREVSRWTRLKMNLQNLLVDLDPRMCTCELDMTEAETNTMLKHKLLEKVCDAVYKFTPAGIKALEVGVKELEARHDALHKQGKSSSIRARTTRTSTKTDRRKRRGH